MENACVCSSKPFILTSKINPQIMFFQKAFLDTLAYDFTVILYKNGRFGEPFKIQLATKWYPNRPSCVKNLHLTSSPACLFSVLILGCILIALWFTFGVFLVPVGSRFHQTIIPKLCFFKRPFWTHLLMILS